MTQSTSRPITRCQICDSANLDSLLFVGFIPPVNTMPEVGSTAVEQPAYPLEWLQCADCSLIQIGTEVNPEILFPPEYPYLSASTKILRDNFAELEREASALLNLAPNDLVIDIGSNDGTLLSNFQRAGYKVLGIEPSLAAEVANANNIPSLMTFFGKEVASDIKRQHGMAKVLTAANVFAHIGNVHGVVDGITELLAPDGVFISESHYVYELIKTFQYDTIYHEHLRYYSLRSLIKLLTVHGLEVFHAKGIPTHGGSIRVYAARTGQRKVDPSVAAMLKIEDALLNDKAAIKDFAHKVLLSKLDLMALLGPLKRQDKHIVGIGAPSRASTLINYLGLDDQTLDAVLEISTSRKLNKYIPGTRIPVLDEKLLFEQQPDYALLLSWHITDELVANLRRKGYKGKFISPLPEPRIIDG